MRKSVWEYPNHKNEDGCIVFDGPKSGGGYGYAAINGKVVRVHRALWEEVNGNIPEGMTVDHMCYQKDCINIEHLRLLSHSDNTKMSRANIERKSKTHCRKGHPYSGKNLYIDKRGSRHCTACTRERTKVWQAEQMRLRHKEMDTRKQMCGNGLHPMTPENTRATKLQGRLCIQCARARSLKWWRKQNK